MIWQLGGNGSGGAARTLGAEFFTSIDALKAIGLKCKLRLPITLSYTYTNAEFLSDFESNFESWGDVYTGSNFHIWLNIS